MICISTLYQTTKCQTSPNCKHLITDDKINVTEQLDLNISYSAEIQYTCT